MAADVIRIGVITPHAAEGAEAEFPAIAPAGSRRASYAWRAMTQPARVAERARERRSGVEP
jgi:hypothetical protein